MTRQPDESLVGRSAERTRLATLLRQAATGGRAVLVEGDAGIGKTALVREVADRARARGFRELGARGVHGADTAGFSGLHQMLHPVLDQIGSLPANQSSALLVAFGHEDGPASDRLLIGLATSGLLATAAGAGPLLVVVDDLHWLDRSSADVVSFVVRRLGAAPVLLVATTRTGETYADRSDSFPDVLRLGPLTPEDSARLLDRVAPGIGARVRRRILHASAGNPLALHELPTAFGDRETLVDQVPMTARLEQAFLAEVTRLPEPSRQVLRVAAAGQDARFEELVAAVRALGHTEDELHEVVKAGLLRIEEGRVSFRHPLVGSAIYGGSPALDRSGAHRALASVTADPVRAAWHRASATYGWDEEVAADLEAGAEAAQRLGANPEAMITYRRAAALSPALRDRVRRLGRAAEAARRGGLTAEAVEMLREASPLAEDLADVRGLARTEWLLSMTSDVPGRGALDLVALAARHAGPSGRGHPAERAEILLWAAIKAWILQEADEVRTAIRHALDAIEPDGRGAPHEIALTLLDPGRGMDALRADLPELAPRILGLYPEMMNVLAFAAEGALDLETAERCWTAVVEFDQASGRIGDEAVTRCGRAMSRILSGELDTGLADAEESLRLSREFDLEIVGAMAAAAVALVRAIRGETAGARAALAEVRAFPGGADFARVRAVASWAEGLVAGWEGRHDDAVDALAGTAVNDPIEIWAGPDLAAAAARAGRPGAARQWFDKVAAHPGAAERLRLVSRLEQGPGAL
ncbi:ATP-binding protein [Paractinoplanes atraurantiacus]|uniref:ATP-binding protein n=1 Tax=Paractinoplanes atraurantiacus TaxID=1036182 RepID=UPI0015CF3D39|nr:AAA family ATPase [Actinoplanes atraurantiacus]